MGGSVMAKEKQPSLGIVRIVPRLVGSSVGAAAACARKLLFGHDEEMPKSAPEHPAHNPKKKTASSTKKKRKKKRAKAAPKRSVGKKR